MNSKHYTMIVILLSLMAFVRQTSGLICYVGIGHKNSNTSQLQTLNCSTFQPETTSSTTGRNATNCIIFYNPVADEAEFGCDRDSVCTVARGIQTTSACYEQTRGSLRCCQDDRCNEKSYLYHMSPPQSATVCYSGSNNGTPSVAEVECPTSWCYQEVVRSNGRVVNQTFGCDSQCTSSVRLPTTANCQEDNLSGGLNRRRCICSTDRCNSKISLIAPPSTPAPTPTASPPLLSMHNPAAGTESSALASSKNVLLAVGAGVVVLLLMVLTAVVVVRYHERRSKTLTFTYTQLTADLATEDATENNDDGGDDDEGLLVA